MSIKISINQRLYNSNDLWRKLFSYKKSKKWLKIRIKEDNYKGYIQNKKFS